MIKQRYNDTLLVLIALMGWGLIQVYSSSFIFAQEKFGDGLYFFKRQVLFTVIGLVVMLAITYIPAKWLEKWGLLLAPVAIFALLFTLVPGIGLKVGGARRWLPGVLGIRIEPCEIFKIALPFLLAAFIALDSQRLGRWNWVLRILSVGIPLGIFLVQPDFGSFTMSVLVICTVIFAYGLPWKYIIGALLGIIPLFAYLMLSAPYRRARVLTFLDPWRDPNGQGFQVIQSLLTFHSGGIFGVGVGDGQGKLFFLPEAHTDFTLAVLGEEMGFLGFAFMMLMYGFLVVRGLQISNRVDSLFLKVLSLGLTVGFAYSVIINIGVVLGLFPTKGLTLPFMSYGGSSLVMSCVLFGILLNIQKQCRS